MASEKQSQKRAELRRLLAMYWEQYDRVLVGQRRRHDLPPEKLREEIEAHALYVFLNTE